MVWFKVDDNANDHPKFRAAGLEAIGLWTVAGSWSSRQLTDGRIPDWYITTWPNGKKLAARLVDARLWHRPGHGCEQCPDIADGYLFHDFNQANPLRDDVLDKRDKKAAAGRKGGYRSGEVRRATAASRNEAPAEAPATATREAPAEAPAYTSGSPRGEPPTRPDPYPTRTSVADLGGDVLNQHARDHNAPLLRPRCDKHTHLGEHDYVPACHECATLRRNLEAARALIAADAAEQRRSQTATDRAAIAACNRCDLAGWRDLPDGSVARCTHDPEAAAS